MSRGRKEGIRKEERKGRKGIALICQRENSANVTENARQAGFLT